MLNFYSFVRDGKSLKTDKPNFATFEDGHISMCITDAILESHKEQTWVKVIGREVLA
jgi:predicted dehydrogenase